MLSTLPSICLTQKNVVIDDSASGGPASFAGDDADDDELENGDINTCLP